MKLLPAVIILSAVACVPVLAQQQETVTKPRAEVSLPNVRALQSLLPTSVVTAPQDPASTGQVPWFSQGTVRLIVPEVKFVVRDGAVYLTLFPGGVFVPMTGGGASGCFGLDLAARIQNLEKHVETSPPKQ